MYVNNRAGGCKYCLTAVKQYSKHDVTLCGEEDIDNYNFDDFDIIHTHTFHEKFLSIFKAKLILGVHGFVFSCPPGGMYCLVLNRFLKEPLTCLNCLGYLGIKTGGDNIKRWHKLAQRADLITVDSEFMKEFYHTYNPTLLSLPLETNILTSCKSEEREDYLLYTGRLSFEKNPHAFVNIINKTGLKGKMIVYDTVDDIMRIKNQYEDILNCNNKNIEVILNPTKEVMIYLVKHAKFTVLPYLFAEPFGVAAANSILCGTPLISFPYGNVRNMTHLLPKTLEEMIQMIQVSCNQYQIELNKTLIKSEELRKIHNPENAILKWDETYEKLMEKQ